MTTRAKLTLCAALLVVALVVALPRPAASPPVTVSFVRYATMATCSHSPGTRDKRLAAQEGLVQNGNPHSGHPVILAPSKRLARNIGQSTDSLRTPMKTAHVAGVWHFFQLRHGPFNVFGEFRPDTLPLKRVPGSSLSLALREKDA